MSQRHRPNDWSTESGVRDDLQRQPHLYFKLAENALLVAENLRDNYFHNTALFVQKLRQKIIESERVGESPILEIRS
ncbi:MAG: hypothetical protein M9890_05160, partial [Thermomicrobiales bacterium]|nr:hypothetical protein [Thermomicrobiales bacterium]